MDRDALPPAVVPKTGAPAPKRVANIVVAHKPIAEPIRLFRRQRLGMSTVKRR